ncbi:NAD(P)-binding protein [Wallemia mellicola CBS 633.66]|uniref:NAD(P)-binding protein n=1 Tax=Wallemia mellicola (strain ATCC MYA-4683 / CBS 633.66) TaxID=671144 RepID=I4Y6F4_WALMC|nr:NAD(P)-binding protein [Wallemia mellicola CBS 633.66]EIM19546.1 NAD(P)-binding protein [Wallemia mellicola CBS 633.66]|eukprot:XP_006960344.1 NAD(P)-binding protein [Wallemia mellicola CBS 633.66]
MVSLLTGVTGNQGSQVLEHMKGQPVRAFVRNTKNNKTKKLQERGIELASGDLKDEESIYTALENVDGAYLVTLMLEKGAQDEVEQGKAFLAAAKRRNLKHLVYSSVEGAERQTGIPHFDSKFEVEELIRESGIPHTIVRPVAFFDNFPKQRGLASFFTLGIFRAGTGYSKKIQLVSCYDIGRVVAAALKNPSKYAGQVIPLAAEELYVSEIQDKYEKALGTRPWKAWLPRFFLYLLPYDIRCMFLWFGQRGRGYRANIPALRREYPGLLTFDEWVKRG